MDLDWLIGATAARCGERGWGALQRRRLRAAGLGGLPRMRFWPARGTPHHFWARLGIERGAAERDLFLIGNLEKKRVLDPRAKRADHPGKKRMATLWNRSSRGRPVISTTTGWFRGNRC